MDGLSTRKVNNYRLKRLKKVLGNLEIYGFGVSEFNIQEYIVDFDENMSELLDLET